MTTPNVEELLKLVDTYASRSAFTERYQARVALTNALKAQAERIATLEDDVEDLQEGIDALCNAIPGYHWSGGAAELIAKCFADRDSLRIELEAIAAAEPVAKLKPCKEGWFIDLDNPPPLTGETIELFTYPMPAESKDAERYRWLRDYLISPSTHFDDLIVSADKAETLNGVIDAARAKGAN